MEQQRKYFVDCFLPGRLQNDQLLKSLWKKETEGGKIPKEENMALHGFSSAKCC